MTRHVHKGRIPAFLGYSFFVIALAVQFTWVFNNTNGSVLLAAVFHGAVNAWNGYIDIYRGHMGGIYAYTALTAVVSIIVVLVFGVKNLSPTKRSAANQRRPAS